MTETALDVVDKNKLRVQKPIFDKEGDSKIAFQPTGAERARGGLRPPSDSSKVHGRRVL